MTIATWILAISTVVLAIEGGTALLTWTDRLRPGRTRRELAALRRVVSLLHHAAWMDVSSHGSRAEVDDKVRAMLMLDGWRPGNQLRAEVDDYDLSRIQEKTAGIPDDTDT